MSTNQDPRRYRVRRATVLVMALAFAVCVGMNVLPNNVQDNFGWPAIAYQRLVVYDAPCSGWHWLPDGVAGNALKAIVATVGIGLLAEWWQRRHEVRGGRYFRFHLATLLIVVLMAGVIIWMNTLAHKWSYGEQRVQGWPFIFRTYVPAGAPLHVTGYERWNWRALAENVLVGLGMTVGCGIVFEWFMRRMAPSSGAAGLGPPT